jgi:hypothetical protein
MSSRESHAIRLAERCAIYFRGDKARLARHRDKLLSFEGRSDREGIIWSRAEAVAQQLARARRTALRRAPVTPPRRMINQ